MIKSFAKSHIGQRKNNEDTILFDKDMGLYIVADGVGGLHKGDLASQMACDIVHDSIVAGETLKEAIYLAHRSIVEHAKQDPQKHGMATTIAAVLFNHDAYEIAWVGDSRVYLWDNKLQLLTRDDSYVELLLENGHISIDELETHPDRNVISQALGVDRKEIRIHSNFGKLEKNQILIICSDGLYTVVKEVDLIQCFLHNQDLESITNDLVNLAVDKDGKDNISLISLCLHEHFTQDETLQKPVVFREFDTQTGQYVNQTINAQKTPDAIETDPELINQTQMTQLSPQEREAIDQAALQYADSKVKAPNYFYLIILLVIVVLIGLFFLF